MDCFSSKTSAYGSALHWEDDVCEILRVCTSAEDNKLICSYFPFPDLNIPLDIVSGRRTKGSVTDVDKLVLQKAEETFRKIATERDSCMASKVTFMSLEREACGFQSRAVGDVLEGINHTRFVLEQRFDKLLRSNKDYEEVEKVRCIRK